MIFMFYASVFLALFYQIFGIFFLFNIFFIFDRSNSSLFLFSFIEEIIGSLIYMNLFTFF